MRCFKPLNSSPSLLVCALAGAFACAASAAPAANDVQSIWLAPTGTSPLSAKAPLRIEISPAESQCRAAYGDEWYERCQLTLGKPGTRVQGVQLTPETAGEWRWASPSTIVFTPKEAWQPGKRFRTSLIADAASCLTDDQFPHGGNTPAHCRDLPCSSLDRPA